MWKHLRDEVLLRLLYETFARISELLNVNVEDTDFNHCAIQILHPKAKAVFRIVDGVRKHVDTKCEPRWVHFGDETRNLLIRYLEGRRKGPLIVNSKGRRLCARQAERIVDHYARKEGIQQVIGHTKNGRETQLVSPKSLREAGERHVDESGGDRDATARMAGHTVRTKETYYKLGSFEGDRKIFRNHHPLMNEDRQDVQ